MLALPKNSTRLLRWCVKLLFAAGIFLAVATATFYFLNRAATAGLAMIAAILVAGFLGIALPFTFRRLGVDTAIASGPLVTTTNDVISVAIYLTLAMAIAP